MYFRMLHLKVGTSKQCKNEPKTRTKCSWLFSDEHAFFYVSFQVYILVLCTCYGFIVAILFSSMVISAREITFHAFFALM